VEWTPCIHLSNHKNDHDDDDDDDDDDQKQSIYQRCDERRLR